MEVTPVITQKLLDEDLERTTYRVSMKGSEYLFKVEEIDRYRVDYKESFSHYELDPKFFSENRPDTFDPSKEIEEIFSELIRRDKGVEMHETEAYSLPESTM